MSESALPPTPLTGRVTPTARTLSNMLGRRSLLCGAHQVLLHPLALYRAWTHLYGPVRDPRLLLTFALHDLGYAFTADIDGSQGQRHPEFGARLITALCDPPPSRQVTPTPWGTLHLGPWGLFTLLHSRTYAQLLGRTPSRLCAADKLAITFEPAYLRRVHLSGEVHEYLRSARTGQHPGIALPNTSPAATARAWYVQARQNLSQWAAAHASTCTPEPGPACTARSGGTA